MERAIINERNETTDMRTKENTTGETQAHAPRMVPAQMAEVEMELTNSLHATLFGKFQLNWRNQVCEGISGRKQQELLSYLLIHRSRPQAREILADLLWGDYPTSRSRKYLRQALWLLQSTLNQNLLGLPETLLVEDDWVQINPEACIQLDIEEFSQASSFHKKISAAACDTAQMSILQKAVELYQGDLLEGWYPDWILIERERFQNEYLELLDKLIEICELRQEYRQGLGYAYKAIHIDPYSERVHGQMMRMLYHSGRRTEALRQYERCARLLREDLNISPSQEIQNLNKQICFDRLNASFSKDPNISGDIPFPETVQSVIALLNQLRDVIDVLQEQVMKSNQQADEASGK